MKCNFNKRIISLVLCLCMIVLPLIYNVPVYAVGNSEYIDNVGCTAVFAGYDAPATNQPDSISDPFDVNQVEMVPVSETQDLIVLITDWYYDPADDLLWYKVEVLSGTVPEKLINYPWVFQDYVNKPMGSTLIINPKEDAALR